MLPQPSWRTTMADRHLELMTLALNRDQQPDHSGCSEGLSSLKHSSLLGSPLPRRDQPTILVVAQDGSQLFYHQNGEPIDSEEVPKGTELTIENVSGERCS